MIFRESLLFRGNRDIFTNESSASVVFYNDFFGIQENATVTGTDTLISIDLLAYTVTVAGAASVLDAVFSLILVSNSAIAKGNSNAVDLISNLAIATNPLVVNGSASLSDTPFYIPFLSNAVTAKGSCITSDVNYSVAVISSQSTVIGSAKAVDYVIGFDLQSYNETASVGVKGVDYVIQMPIDLGVFYAVGEASATTEIVELVFESEIVTATGSVSINDVVNDLQFLLGNHVASVKFIDSADFEIIRLRSVITTEVSQFSLICSQKKFKSTITSVLIFK